MIVVKTWVTRDRKEYGWNDPSLKIRFRKWKGYFLFGIIPLYIENYFTEYTRI